MPKYLIDENLPYKFSLWNGEDYVHVLNIGGVKSDRDIWNYAKKNNLTIVTKDADFSDLILISDPPPRVIHVRIGNMKISAFFIFLDTVWKEAVSLSGKHKLVNIYIDRIEAIK